MFILTRSHVLQDDIALTFIFSNFIYVKNKEKNKTSFTVPITNYTHFS